MEFLFRCYAKTATEMEGQGEQAANSVVRFCPPVTSQGVEAFELRMTEAAAKAFKIGEEYSFSISAGAS